MPICIHKLNLFRMAKKYLPFQVGDALKTSSNIKKLKKIINFTPRVKIESGIKNFVEWYKSYYKIK